MPKDDTLARSLMDLGGATWFGGTLMGATGLNGAAAVVDDPRQRARVANAGWARWTPINAVAIAADLAGGAMLTWGNKSRIASQPGVARATAIKTGLKVAALGATAYSRVLGKRVEQAGDVPVQGGTTPSSATPSKVTGAQRQLNVLQWVIPGLVGADLVMNSVMGEQQRPKNVIASYLNVDRIKGIAPWAIPVAGLALVARSRRNSKQQQLNTPTQLPITTTVVDVRDPEHAHEHQPAHS